MPLIPHERKAKTQLCLTLKARNDNERKKKQKKANASAKSKELHPTAQSRPNAAHLLLPQRTRNQF
jgi:hypothetical protein